MVVEERSFNQLTPEKKVEAAGRVANLLKDVVDKQKLYTMIGPNKYVTVEGWQTLGNLVRVLPRERNVIRHEDGSYEAFVDLVNENGVVVGGGSGYCGMDEKTWKSRPDYARRSMAITRATGKAYRLSYSWVMNLAGYQVTPLEEMPEVYKATNTQKIDLAKYAKQHGVEETQALKELSEEAIKAEVTMGELPLFIKEYIDNLGAV